MLLLGHAPGMGLGGTRVGKKNFRVGICNGVPSTAHYSCLCGDKNHILMSMGKNIHLCSSHYAVTHVCINNSNI